MVLDSEFEWEVPRDGFAVAVAPKDSVIRPPESSSLPIPLPTGESCTRAEWIGAGGEDDGLERVLIPSTPAKPQSYRPLVEQPGLFRRFAELEESELAIVKFASQFGPLFHPDHRVVAPWHTQQVSRVPAEYWDTLRWDALVSGTPLQWGYQIRRLRGVVELQEAIISGDPDNIDSLVSWSGTTATLDGDGWPIPLEIDAASRNRRLQVAMALRDEVISRGLGSRPRQRGVVRLHMSRGALRIRPTNLLGVMWLQLAAAVEEGKNFRRCPARDCPVVWFEVSTGPLGVREDAEHCSARCRHTAYRDRKASARQMHRDSIPVSEIAKRLKTDARRVRSWLGKK